MRIGLDLTAAQGEFNGMGRVALSLARSMPGLAPLDTFVLFLPPGASPPGEAPNVEIVRVNRPTFRGAQLLTEQWHLPRAAARARLDLLHTIAFGPPILYRGVKVLTIHDLGFRLFPATVPARFSIYWNWAYGPAARGCRHLIAVSESTRGDVIRLLGRPPEEISVVPNGVDEAYLAPDAGHAPPPPVDRCGPYILNIGVLQPRKDLETLLRTFALIRDRHPELTLVICGSPGWGYSDVAGLPARRGLTGGVRFVSGVPQAEMPALYRGASLFLFTSIHEGFGLPLLEAMASGVPVVATDTSAIPEVVGEAARLAPVGDDAGLARAALDLLEDPVAHAEMAGRGRERAAAFSWERSARLTLDVYRRVLAV